MSKVKITVDGRVIEADDGALLIEVLLANGVDIPHFCYHEALGPDGNCRMCMVKLQGAKRPQIACDTFVCDGMEVSLKDPEIRTTVQRILELELINHPIDCPTCDQAGECRLQDYYMEYGLYDSSFENYQKIHHAKHTDLGSNVMLDQERCVLCARCTRFTSNITKTNELGIIGRGDEAHVSTMPGKTLDNPYAMNIIDLCPVGALTSRDFRFARRVWFLGSAPSVCHGCDRGCNITIDHDRPKNGTETIYRFRPRKNERINGHFICDAGRLSYREHNENRQLQIIREGQSIGREEALEAFEQMIGSQKRIMILADANLYNEDLRAIKWYAKEIGALLFVPLESYRDESFGDDWLRSSMRAANARGVENMGINREVSGGYDIDVLINFNHPTPHMIAAGEFIEFQTHQSTNADLIFPLAMFSEYGGTLTNRDNITQDCMQAVNPSGMSLSAQEWVKLLPRRS